MAGTKKARRGLRGSKALLDTFGLRPRKSLGQYFIKDPAVINKIISRAHLNKKDVVVEIGPGLGALTVPIMPYIHHLVAIEKDRLLMHLLKDKFTVEERQKVTFISGDVLKIDFKEIYETFRQKVRIVGNLPYNISSPFLEKLTINRNYITNAILMFQYELAQRLIAGPKRREYGALSVTSQYYAKISPLIKITRDAFHPTPKVDSMVIEIDFEKPYPLQVESEASFQRVVRAAFSCRRKTILNSLERGIVAIPREILGKALEESSIDPKRRAETLTIDEYIRLSSLLARTRQFLDTQ
jgi:16S rRNA (adenine1518-N6/adenine1519-N6)-dimethyltransferase